MEPSAQNSPQSQNVDPAVTAQKKKTRLWLFIIGIAVVLAAAVTALAVIFYNQNEAAKLESQQVDGPTVAITPSGFSPSTITVQPGQEVTWNNQDGRDHVLTADKDALPEFGAEATLHSGDSYTYVFDDPGTYRYYDVSDPTAFNGTVIVGKE